MQNIRKAIERAKQLLKAKTFKVRPVAAPRRPPMARRVRTTVVVIGTLPRRASMTAGASGFDELYQRRSKRGAQKPKYKDMHRVLGRRALVS